MNEKFAVFSSPSIEFYSGLINSNVNLYFNMETFQKSKDSRSLCVFWKVFWFSSLRGVVSRDDCKIFQKFLTMLLSQQSTNFPQNCYTTFVGEKSVEKFSVFGVFGCYPFKGIEWTESVCGGWTKALNPTWRGGGAAAIKILWNDGLSMRWRRNNGFCG